jgi:DNA-binding CsgD family transcriptional regulator
VSVTTAEGRSEELPKAIEDKALIEAMLELTARPLMALSLQGRLLWVSAEAAKWMGLRRDGRWVAPDSLVDGVRRLGALVREKGGAVAPEPMISVHRDGNRPLSIDLRLHRTRTGDPFVVAELDVLLVIPPLSEIASRHRLTGSETAVLRLISRGLSEQAIARRLCVSRATVHAHTARLYVKLRVHSRVQAALVALGLRPRNA